MGLWLPVGLCVLPVTSLRICVEFVNMHFFYIWITSTGSLGTRGALK